MNTSAKSSTTSPSGYSSCDGHPSPLISNGQRMASPFCDESLTPCTNPAHVSLFNDVQNCAKATPGRCVARCRYKSIRILFMFSDLIL